MPCLLLPNKSYFVLVNFGSFVNFLPYIYLYFFSDHCALAKVSFSQVVSTFRKQNYYNIQYDTIQYNTKHLQCAQGRVERRILGADNVRNKGQSNLVIDSIAANLGF